MTQALVGEARVSPRDSLGCSLSHLENDRQIRCAGMMVYRKASTHEGRSPVETPASDRGVLVGTSLRPGHRRRIFQNGHAQTCDFRDNAVYVRNFEDPYRAEMESPFDFLLIEMSSEALNATDQDEGCGRGIGGLNTCHGGTDDVLLHLAHALLPALEQPQRACTLFVSHMALAIRTHLTCRYGGVPIAPRKPGQLSRAQEALAKELLMETLDGNIPIGDIASACNLSRSYFIRAFRDTIGATPYQWLLGQRVARAKTLLLSSRLPLVEVAVSCGFADQSHFTRVFSRMAGDSPAAWKRRQ